MNRMHIVVLCVGLLLIPSAVAMAVQGVPEPVDNQGWPFGDQPRRVLAGVEDDFVITIGTTASVPGSLVIAGLGVSFNVDPFFTTSQTDFVVLPTFAATQSLETGLDFEWWTASVDIELSVSPWSLTSTGGWLELHPPQWVVFETPWITLEGTLGWGPRWVATDDWSHALSGSLDIRAVWALPTLWDNSLDLTVASNADAVWTFPNGTFLTNWMFQLDARSILPLFLDSPVALRAGVRAQAVVLPTFGFGFDVRLELRANAFVAYGVIGAGGTGIRAEVGMELTIGWKFFEGLD